MGSRTTVVTDYPDWDLVTNLQFNADSVAPLIPEGTALKVEGYRWGDPVDKLVTHLPQPSQGFDLVILADVIYNHPQHHNLIKSIQMTLKRSADALALVVSTPYQPWLKDKIWKFFPLTEEAGFTVTPIFEKKMEKLLFEDDPGDEEIRRTVYGYELRWKAEELNKSRQLAAAFERIQDAVAQQLPDQPRYKVQIIAPLTAAHARTVYDNARAEKEARAVAYGTVKRALARDTIVIADGMNYIKGWRYQLWCEAKAANTTCCVVQIGTPPDQCRRINQERIAR
ncbi:nicotinamide n-methyltransferase, partial [Ascosphaera acerosa]